MFLFFRAIVPHKFFVVVFVVQETASIKLAVSSDERREKHKHKPFSFLLYAHALFAHLLDCTPSDSLTECVRLFWLITLHSVRRSTGRDCFPKMAPACFREGTGFLNFLFNKPSVHLQSSQCFVLHVGTLIMLPWTCGAILSLVSGIELRIYFLFYMNICPYS